MKATGSFTSRCRRAPSQGSGSVRGLAPSTRSSAWVSASSRGSSAPRSWRFSANTEPARWGLFAPGTIALSFVGPVLYHALAESMGGATLGKLLCGLRVVGEDYRPISFGAGAIRSVAYFLDAFCFGMVAYSFMQGSSLNQRLGDKWAHSVVVRVEPGPSRPVFPGIAIGLAAWLTTQLVGWVFVGL